MNTCFVEFSLNCQTNPYMRILFYFLIVRQMSTSRSAAAMHRRLPCKNTTNGITHFTYSLLFESRQFQLDVGLPDVLLGTCSL